MLFKSRVQKSVVTSRRLLVEDQEELLAIIQKWPFYSPRRGHDRAVAHYLRVNYSERKLEKVEMKGQMILNATPDN